MPENNNYAEIFTKPEAPRSDWELFKWLFFEPTLLDRWSEGRKQNRKENSLQFLRIYFKYITPLVICCWLLMIVFFIIYDLPASHPEYFNLNVYEKSDGIIPIKISTLPQEELSLLWRNAEGFWEKGVFLFKGLAVGLAFGLAIGLAGGFAIGLDEELALLLAVGWAGGLVFGLAFGFAYGLAFGLAFGFAYGLAFGLGEESDSLGLSLGLVFGMLIGLGLGFAYGFAYGLAVGLSFYIIQLRLIFYPFYGLTVLRPQFLHNNPYLRDEGIWLPLPWVKKALIEEAKERPDIAFRFVVFLLRYRRLQWGLAAEIELAATAGLWRSVLQLRSALFTGLRLLSEELPKGWAKLMPSTTISRYLPEGWAKLMPSTTWRDKIGEIRDTLAAAEDTTAVVTQLTLYQKCKELVEEFRQINLRETFKGRDEFFAVIDHWNTVLDNQIQETAKIVNEIQAVTLNPYSKGSALSPEIPQNKLLFLDRADIREELSIKIQTSVIMPTFLILGQRRVGKTSLLNFLPSLLDPTLYDVVVVDAQSLSGEVSLIKWLVYWRSRIESKLKLPATEPTTATDALSAWDEFAAFLDGLAQTRKRRLILAMDEYDEDRGFHYAIRQDPEVGAAFLGRMRAFSQQQKMVVFMFVGATNFSDLPEPKWSKYFVHVHEVRVDYLSEQASMQIIERPIPGFGLRYAEGVAAHIYHLTQGHPHLLHTICSDLVDYANMKVKNPVDRDDLAYILQSKVLLGGAQPFSVFWDEFCEKESMKEAVRAIAAREGNIAKTAEVRKLLDYGFIVPDQALGFRMRVPLFEEWVKEYGY
jgi:hypothetical protein